MTEGIHPKVAIVYRMDHPGGVQSVALAVIRGLNRQGIEPVIVWDVPPSETLLKKANCRAAFQPIRFAISTPFVDKLPATLRYLAQILNCFDGNRLAAQFDFFYIFWNGFLVKGDIPHLRYLSGSPLLPQLVKIPVGWRGYPIRLLRWLYAIILKKFAPVYEFHADNRYVINSQFTADLFFAAHAVRLPVVYPPIDFSGRHYDPEDLEKRDSLTFFSRIVDYKRPDLMLKLAARVPEMRCVVMGGVPVHRLPFVESLKRQAQNEGLKNICFLLNPDRAEVQAELARTRYFFFPAVNEHFGMTTVEAIASGALPFVHNSGGQREIVPFEELRFDDDHLLARFEQLLAWNTDIQNNYRRQLLNHIQQFSEERSVDTLLSYLSIASQPILQPAVG